MLDMGFEPSVREIVGLCSLEGRQTTMFSATWPKEVQSLASEFLCEPVQIRVGHSSNPGDSSLHANKNVTQQVEVVHNESQKMEMLQEILNVYSAPKTVDGVLNKASSDVDKTVQKDQQVIVFVLRK